MEILPRYIVTTPWGGTRVEMRGARALLTGDHLSGARSGRSSPFYETVG